MGLWLSINISDRLSATCGHSECCLNGGDHIMRKVGSLAIFEVVLLLAQCWWCEGLQFGLGTYLGAFGMMLRVLGRIGAVAWDID